MRRKRKTKYSKEKQHEIGSNVESRRITKRGEGFVGKEPGN